MAGEARVCLLAVALAEELRLGVGPCGAGVVRAILSLELGPAAAEAWTFVGALQLEALHRGLSLKKLAIHRQEIVRDPAVPPYHLHHQEEEQIRHFVRQQPLLVLAERGGVEHRLDKRWSTNQRNIVSFCIRAHSCLSGRMV